MNTIITRKDVLKRAKKTFFKKKCFGLCNAIHIALDDLTGIKTNHDYNLQEMFPLFTKEKAKFFGGSKSAYWWTPRSFGLFSGRRRFLNWLIAQYKDDTEDVRVIYRKFIENVEK